MIGPLTRFGPLVTPAALAAALLLSADAFGEAADQQPQAETAGQTDTGGKGADTNGKSAEQAADQQPAPYPPASVTRHSIHLAGKDIPYSAKADTLSLRDAQGKTLADIFYVAYTREPQNAKRPVTFVFNGGPGAASAYLHLGAIGPSRVAASAKGELLGPPPHLVANDASWLDFTDLVFVDPVATGYSRARDSKKESDFFGIKQDTEALADFIRLYLTHEARLASPVFLAGESYGGFRAATITRRLQKVGGISPNGIILISPALEFELLNADDYDLLPWALTLPSFAAVNLENDGVSGRQALADALKDAERYALTDYLVALASGAEQGADAASDTVARLTGLPIETVRRNFARIAPSTFIKNFDRSNGQVLSRYDGSIGAPDPNPASAWPHGPDPVLDSTVPLWTGAFVRYAQEELGYKTDMVYRLLNREVRGKWDFGTRPTRQGYAGVLDDIQKARATNRKLEVFIANGYTDLITPYMAPVYLVNQLTPLKGASPIAVETYAGGHMLYLRPETRRALKRDVEAMYERALDSPPQG